MNNKRKIILGVIGFGAFILLAAVLYNTLQVDASKDQLMTTEATTGESNATNEAPADTDPNAGLTKAPDFTVIDSNGNSVKLSSLVGKPMVINFWASWCPPCKEEMPVFNKIHGELGDEISFMMVDMVDGQRETKAKGEKYVKDNSFTFPVYYDTDEDAAYTYGVESLPTTYFINADGYVVTGARGAIDEATLRKGIDLIAE